MYAFTLNRRLVFALALLLLFFTPACAKPWKDIEAKLEKAYAAEDSCRFKDAIVIYEQCLKEIPADSATWISDIYASLVCCHFRLGKLHEAISYGERGLRIDEKMGDKERVSSSLSNLASIFIALNRTARAEQYLLRSIALERELDGDASLAIRLGMLAELYTKQNKPAKALPLAKEALDIDRKGGREKKMAIRMSQYGNALVSLKRTDEAMPYLKEALRLHRKYDNKPSLAITLVTLGIAEYALHHEALSKTYLHEAVSLSEKHGFSQQLMTAHLELSRQYGKANDPLAYGHLLKYNEIKDSVTNVQVQQQLNDLEVRYETKQKEQELVNKELLIQRQRFVDIALVVALLLMAAVVVMLAKSIRLKNQNMQLKDRFMQLVSHDLKTPALAQQKNLRMLTKAVGVLPDDDVRTMVNRLSEDADAHVSLLYSLLDWAGLQTGRLRYTPITINLVSVVEEVVAQHRAQAEVKGIAVSFVTDEAEHNVVADRQMVEAMVRNLLSNAIKFSLNGGSITVTVNGTTVTIDDEGIGLGSESNEQGTGIGLNLVRRLAEINKVTFNIAAKPTKGTKAELVFEKLSY